MSGYPGASRTRRRIAAGSRARRSRTRRPGSVRSGLWRWRSSVLGTVCSRVGRARLVSRARPHPVDRPPRPSLWQVGAIRDAEREGGLAVHLLLWRRALELAVAEGHIRGHQAARILRRPDVVADGEQLARLHVVLLVRAAGRAALLL